MSNGLKQVSVVSPHLFDVYLGELNYKLSYSNIGCHTGDALMNHFAYADDLTLEALTARALNKLLEICQNFPTEHFILHSASKNACMAIPPEGVK